MISRWNMTLANGFLPQSFILEIYKHEDVMMNWVIKARREHPPYQQFRAIMRLIISRENHESEGNKIDNDSQRPFQARVLFCVMLYFRA